MDELFRALVYKTAMIYDSAPEHEIPEFDSKDPQKLIRAFEGLSADTVDEKDAIGTAFNYHYAHALFAKSYRDLAEHMIKTLADVIPWMQEIDEALKSLDTSYVEMCSLENRLLVPRELDEAVFRELAPLSVRQAGKYFGRGYAVVYEDQLRGAFCATIQEPEQYGLIDLGCAQAKFNKTCEYPVSSAREVFKVLGIDDFSIIYAGHDKLYKYTDSRFISMTISDHLKQLSLETDMGFERVTHM